MLGKKSVCVSNIICGYWNTYQFVPLWYNVGNWATSIRLAEGHTTVHAASSLVLELVFVQTLVKLGPVAGSGLRVAVLLRSALVLHETARLV
jgi:hypothetical protein